MKVNKKWQVNFREYAALNIIDLVATPLLGTWFKHYQPCCYPVARDMVERCIVKPWLNFRTFLYYSVRSGQLRNLESAKVSMQGQLVK